MAMDGNAVDRRTILKTSGAGIAGITGLAGCTTNSTSSGDSSDDPILIGATVPETGSLSSTGTSILLGYQLGIEHINNSGGINGREVELIVRDDESEADKTRSNLRQIVSNNDVAMLWGSFSSLLVTAGSAFAEQQELPFLGTTFAHMEPHLKDNYEWTFSPFPKSRDIARNTKEWFDTLEPDPPRRLAIWELNSGWGEELAEQWAQVFEGTDYEIVFRQTYQVGASDFSTMISETKSKDVDAVLSNPVPPDGITAVNQMADQNFSPDLINFIRASDPRAWTSALGKTGDYVGSSGVGWLAGLDTTGTEDLLDLYYQQDDVDEDTVPLDVVGDAFGLTQVAAQALESAGSTESTEIREVLLNETFDTTLGQFSFEENGMPVEGELAPACGQWHEGDPMLVHPQTDSEYSMETVYPMPEFGNR